MSADLETLERARADEAPRVAEFARRTFADAFGEDMGEVELARHFREKMSDAHFEDALSIDRFYVTKQGHVLTGFVQVGTVNPDYRAHVEDLDVSGAEVRRLYVLAAHQGRGLGSALLDRALNDDFVLEADVTYLTTWEANHGAQKLYRAHGFEKVGEIPEYARDGRLNGYEHVMARRRPPRNP